jgi:hypothetical protein
MPAQVILYFDDEADALRFALVAGAVMAGDEPASTNDLVQRTASIQRIRVAEANVGNDTKLCRPEPAA